MPYRLAAHPKVVTALVKNGYQTLGVNQRGFAKLVATSLRTVSRWTNGSSFPSAADLTKLARLVHPRDPALAAQIASAAGGTVESLGIAPPAPPPRASPAQLVEQVLYAAAEAADLSPRAVRPALVAAFRRASQARLTLDEALAALEAQNAAEAR